MNTFAPVYAARATRTNGPRAKYPTYDRPVMFDAPDTVNGRVPLPTAISLFSGLGSSSLALRGLGHQVLAHDFLPEAVASLNANGFDAVQGDIRAVDFSSWIYRDVEVIIGGPPCQPFSPAGRNKGEHDERDMIPDFIRAVAQILPELFVMEETRGLASPRHKDYLALRVSEFEALGYAVEHRVLDAADHGVAQNRKRLFVIGRRVDTVTFGPRPVFWPIKAKRQPTMAEALGWTAEICRQRNQLAPEAAQYNPDRDDWDTHLWPLRRPSTTVVGSFRPEVQAGRGLRNAGDGPRQNAPGSVVTTLEERLILQGMPADWKVIGSEGKRALQVGNSCPNPLLYALLKVNGAQR